MSNEVTEIKTNIEKFMTREFEEAKVELMSATNRFVNDYSAEAAGELRKAHVKFDYIVEVGQRLTEFFELDQPAFVDEAKQQKLGF